MADRVDETPDPAQPGPSAEAPAEPAGPVGGEAVAWRAPTPRRNPAPLLAALLVAIVVLVGAAVQQVQARAERSQRVAQAPPPMPAWQGAVGSPNVPPVDTAAAAPGAAAQPAALGDGGSSAPTPPRGDGAGRGASPGAGARAANGQRGRGGPGGPGSRDGQRGQGAPGGPGGQPRRSRLERMAAELDLSPEQQAKLAAIQKEYGPKMQALRDNAQLSDEDRRAQFRTLMEQQTAAFRKVLTPEQQKKMDELRSRMRRGPGGQSGPGGPGGPGGADAKAPAPAGP